ncbi:unnamed protein product [Euphydryas editha]|uniref:Protein G12 n=1 Tax=Euphydryas editha TaxID=104508 RepID=A0AAU9UYP8_EUPED|nr:unnamed protein product [Euphydryas editha]
MFKYMLRVFAFIFVVSLCCEGTVVRIPNRLSEITLAEVLEKELPIPWQDHVMDFINLVDVEKILSTVVKYIDDPEVMSFVGFFLSPKFKNMVMELETMDEFKEAYLYLASKGYDVKDVIDSVNKLLSLPMFDNPEENLRTKNGDVSKFIAAIVGTIPVKDMKDLLKSKMEKYPEVAEFIEVIKSPEFIDIMGRMLTSQKFGEFKSTFESYGVDFNYLCEIMNEAIGDEHEHLTCGNTEIEYS